MGTVIHGNIQLITSERNLKIYLNKEININKSKYAIAKQSNLVNNIESNLDLGSKTWPIVFEAKCLGNNGIL